MMQGYGYGPGIGHGGGLLGGVFMFLFGVALIGGIVVLVVWAVRASSHGHHHAQAAAPQQSVATPQSPVMPAAGHEEAVAIAKRRYASGEITKEQYEEIVGTLGG